MLKKTLMAWSSGKDSAWALHVLRQQPDVEVVGLLTTLNGPANRVAMHGVRRALLDHQARETGVPVIAVSLPSPCTNKDYGRLMSLAIMEARADGVTHVAFGDLFLEDVRAYRVTRLAGTGIDPLFPLWCSTSATPELARTMLTEGVRAIVVCVDSNQLDPKFLGREFDKAFLDQLPPSVDPCGERGEFHTFCYAGPMFERSIPVMTGETVVRDQFHFIDLSNSRGT